MQEIGHIFEPCCLSLGEFAQISHYVIDDINISSSSLQLESYEDIFNNIIFSIDFYHLVGFRTMRVMFQLDKVTLLCFEGDDINVQLVILLYQISEHE